jgi:tetratricopeptide (TPR) repeat protein
MSKFDDVRPLLGYIIFAVLAAGQGLPAQEISAAPAQTAAPVQTAPETPPPIHISVVPATPPTQEEIGDSLAVHQKYQAAIAAYARADKMTPVIWNKMGIAYQMMFNLKDATRCYNESLKMDPHNAQVLNNLATVYDSQKQYKMAEKYYKKALKLNPHSALILRNYGSNLLARHKYKKGSDAYHTALTIDPEIFQTQSGASVQNPTSVQDRGALHYYMARGCVAAGNSVCAIENLRRAINEGFITAKKASTDSSFNSIRELPGFQELIASQTPQQ